ncbi:hypothetical protein MFLAVUS_005619 [Mucor flavus]|uniref:RRM domain-containing protein n=1 Tax=Mucor flavus TaxID=439312 RepID=A0ABP9YZ87_9FUNG
MKPCCDDQNLSVTLSEINPNNTAAETKTWLASLCLSEPFEHFKLLKDKPYGFLRFLSRENACKFFKKYGNSKLDESRNTRLLGSIDWNRQPISYDIPSHQKAPNP